MPGLREDTRGASSCVLPAQALGAWSSSVRSNNDVRPGWRGLEEAECSANAPALPAEARRQLCKPALISQSWGWRCRLHNPQGWGQAFDVPAWALPARALPLVYFSTSSCHPFFLSFPSSDSAWMWGK